MKELIEKLPEVYQDIELDGKVIHKGVRECGHKWKLIEEHIHPHDVVLDLGSAEGYFSHKIAKTFPDSLVISFESEPDRCEVQKEIFRREGIYNVVVCNHRLDREDLEKWTKHVECFDVVLALSVLHHFPEDDVGSVFSSLTDLSPFMIAEVAAGDEVEACGGKSKSIAEAFVKSLSSEQLGTAPSHLGDYERSVSIVENMPMRKNLDAYFDVSHEGRHKFE